VLNYPEGTARNPTAVANRIALDLFQDATFNIVLDRWEGRSSKSFNWLGHIEGVPRSHVTLVVEDGVMVGTSE
jgi:hypothetical protein